MSSFKNIGIIGLGWLGCDLAVSLLDKGYTVWGTARSFNADKNEKLKGVELVEWEYPDLPIALQSCLQSADLLIVTIPPGGFSSDEYTKCMALLIENAKTHCKFIFTSSIGVYPKLADKFDEKAKIDENHPVSCAERQFLSWRKEQTTILRLGGLVGEDRNPVHFLVNKINSDPDGFVHLIHRNDVIGVVQKTIKANYFGEILNVVHPERITRSTYYRNMAQHLSLNEPQFNQLSTFLTHKLIISNKLVEDLNYEPNHSVYGKMT